MIGLLTLAAIPTTIGVAEGVSHQKQQQQQHDNAEDDEKRMAKFYLDAHGEGGSSRAREIDGRRVVLRDGKSYLSSSSSSSSSSSPSSSSSGSKPSYTLRAFYIEYPDEQRKPAPLGLVSHVADDPPLLNWMYVDKNTMELKHGNRSQSREHHVGPWDWAEDDEAALTFEGWQGFMAVQDEEGDWQLFFDRDDDGLRTVVGKRRRRLEITLLRTMCEDGKG